MKTEKVLKIFSQAVEVKGYRFITENVIEKDGDFFTCCRYLDGRVFVDAEKQSEPFTRLIHLGRINTLKVLKMRLGL